METKFKKIACWLLICITLASLCACANGKKPAQASEDDKVRSAVESMGRIEYFGSSIGGNDLKSSVANIITVRKVKGKPEVAIKG